MSKFLTTQLKRVPAGKNRFLENFDQVAEQTRTSSKNEIDVLIDKDSSLSNIGEQRKLEIDTVVNRYKKEPPDNIWFQTIGPDYLDNITKAIYSMKWFFFHIKPGEQFLTSDNPAFVFDSLGIGNSNSELSFPISHNIVLCADRRKRSEMQYIAGQHQLVLELNRRTVSNATRFVYARDNTKWLEPFVFKNKHSLRSII
jgi:hypothetical protein